MRTLAQKRLRRNTKQSMRYLALVFNDFFVLALFFLMGAALFAYMMLLKRLPMNLWFYKPLIILILFLLLGLGDAVTLLESADRQFLFPQDHDLTSYLIPMLRYSLIFPMMMILLGAGLIFPFAGVKAEIPIARYAVLVLGLLALKYDVILEKIQAFSFSKSVRFWLLPLISLIFLILCCYSNFWLSILGLFALLGYVFFQRKQGLVLGRFDWLKAVQHEKKRKHRVYEFYGLFTDVEEQVPVIKRRHAWDVLLPRRLSIETPNTFLYRRALLRNPEYANLVFRMTVFAVLIAWISGSWQWGLGLDMLVLLLTVEQLLPLIFEFARDLMYRSQPISTRNRGR